jgi:hypothetical protein
LSFYYCVERVQTYSGYWIPIKWFANISFHSLKCFFHFIMFFEEQKFLILMKFFRISFFFFARQVLYHLSHTSSTFCSGYFGDGSHFLPSLDHNPVLCFPLLLGWQMHATMASFFLPLRWCVLYFWKSLWKINNF